MSAETMALAPEGFAAWRRGDFAAIEAMLDPNVQMAMVRAGRLGLSQPVDVMQVLTERYDQGFARGELEFLDGGADAVVVVAHPAAIGGEEWPEETATVITFADGKVTHMQDYRTRDEALEAAG